MDFVASGRTYKNQSISFPPELLDYVRLRAESLGLSLSAYIQRCVEEDRARGGGPLLIRERPELADSKSTAAVARLSKGIRSKARASRS